jgi:hypothetical protein
LELARRAREELDRAEDGLVQALERAQRARAALDRWTTVIEQGIRAVSAAEDAA